jgi:hypothetical protein
MSERVRREGYCERAMVPGVQSIRATRCHPAEEPFLVDFSKSLHGQS